MHERSKNNKSPAVVFLMGPTAAGKTELVMNLHQAIDSEIISVDSALVYKNMDIGTAKPTEQQLARAPHRLISFLEPTESYSVADFCNDALTAIEDIHQQGKTPLLVGGTMLYFKALLEGISPLPKADYEIRADIENEARQRGWQYLHQQLNKIDSIAALRIHPNDTQRISRAIEVFRISGKTLTELLAIKGAILPFDVYQFAIAPEKAILHQRIEQRFKQMLDEGFENEVRALYQRKDLHLNLPSMRCVGYRQMWEHFDGLYDFDEMVYRGIVATRQLAKRQMTWLNRWSQLHWLKTGDKENLQHVLCSLC